MEFKEYREMTLETATYPKEVGLAYCTLGLVGETGELSEIEDSLEIEELEEEVKDRVLKEGGDAVWYCVSICNELGCTDEEAFKIFCDWDNHAVTNTGAFYQEFEFDHFIKFSFIYSSMIAETVKKLYRDGKNGESAKRDILSNLECYLVNIGAICNEFGHSFDDVLNANYKKLNSRKERGVLSGSGDNR